MKKSICFPLLSLLLISLSSCINLNNGQRVELVEKTMSLYSLDTETENNDILDTHKIFDDVPYIVVKDKDYTPYVTVETFERLFSDLYIKGYYSTIIKDSTDCYWYIYNPNNNPQFLMHFDVYNKACYQQGNIGCYKSKTSGPNSMRLGMNINGYVVTPGKREVEYSYGESGYKTYTINGDTYFPLSLLSTIFNPLIGYKLYYSYQNLYRYDDESKLWDVTYYSDESKTTTAGPYVETKDIINNKFNKKMPLYLREERLQSLYFLFDNLYGLKETRKIKSMKEYFISKDYEKGLLSEDNNVRNETTAKLFRELNDGHTNLSTHQKVKGLWGNETDNYSRWDELWINRLLIRENLLADRKAFYEDNNEEETGIIYSNNGKYAFLSFDSFESTTNYMNDDQTYKPSLYQDDTFFRLATCFKNIKDEHPTVENVIIDISCNGGGLVGILMKLIALMSDNNNSVIYFYNDSVDSVEKYVTSVDSNHDGGYNLDDVYGDDFNFYVLESEFSFSCGNAFPFYLQKEGIATIIGNTSGGGECTVAENVLPTGESFRHSSNNHIVWCDLSTNDVVGDESGVTPEIKVQYQDYFDLEKLITLIEA